MGMASSHAGDGDPSKNRQGDPRRRREFGRSGDWRKLPLLPAISAPWRATGATSPRKRGEVWSLRPLRNRKLNTGG
jgi:hypothetical protein